jgi:hypothetical protein
MVDRPAYPGFVMGGIDLRLAPIEVADVPRVGRFLHAELNARVSADAWAQAMLAGRNDESPNLGFMLIDRARIVGACLAFYSDRTIAGRTERFCNLGAWCVTMEHRAQGLRLVRAVLSQPDFHFTDFSPSGNVVALNERLGFRHLDTTTALIPNINVQRSRAPVRIISDHEKIAAALSGNEKRLFRDHQHAAAARHLVIQVGPDSCYVIVRKDRRKGLPVFASIIFVSDPDVLRRSGGALFRHLLVRQGAVATLAELGVSRWRPPFSRLLSEPRPKMFKSPTLDPESIDYLYSELTWVAW